MKGDGEVNDKLIFNNPKKIPDQTEQGPAEDGHYLRKQNQCRQFTMQICEENIRENDLTRHIKEILFQIRRTRTAKLE